MHDGFWPCLEQMRAVVGPSNYEGLERLLDSNEEMKTSMCVCISIITNPAWLLETNLTKLGGCSNYNNQIDWKS